MKISLISSKRLETSIGCHQHLEDEYILPISAPAERFRYERHIKTLSRRIMTTYRLLIAIEHAWPNWPLVDFRKLSLREITEIRQISLG